MSTARNIGFLDFARGYAIATIVAYHTFQRLDLPPLAQQAAAFGGSGVHLFFLLSGFGLALSTSTQTTLGFYRRRAVKVWWPYALALSLSLLGAFGLDLFPDRWAAWLAGVGLYQMFEEQYIHSFGGHYWFISAIIQFYLVYPLLLRIKERFANPWYYFALCMAVSVAWWLIVWFTGHDNFRTWNSSFLQFLWEFGLGQVLAGLYLARPEGNTGRIRGDFWNYTWWTYLPVGLLFTGLMVAMILRMGPAGRVFNDIPALIGYSALCIFVYRAAELFLPPVRQFFVWVGGFSYSLYLVHVLVLDLFLMGLGGLGVHFSMGWVVVYWALAIIGGRLFEAILVNPKIMQIKVQI
jgi:peptidoglycan/LPS O-acetylase OafA/YrhL